MITTATVTLEGRTWELAYNPDTGLYEAEITAPEKSSWKLPGHVYTGTVYARNRDDLGGENFTTAETSVRVLEKVPPKLVVIDPENWQITTARENTFRWLVRDAESGVDPDALKLLIDGVEQDGIDYTMAGDSCICSWSGEVAELDHVLTFSAADNDMNVTEVELNYAALFFITDRTLEDVSRAEYLNDAVTSGRAGPWELEEFESELKGAYNSSDMNRVGLGVWFLKNWAARYGYNLNVTARHDWDESISGPTETECAAYLADIAEIRKKLPMPPDVVQPPGSMRFSDYEDWNNIERVLTEAVYMLPVASLSWFAAGEVAAGEI